MLVMLDRDGVLNEDRADFVKSPAELRLLPGAAEAVARLNRAGHKVVVCTNQSCVGRGIIDRAMLDKIHQFLTAELGKRGARLDALLVATDAPWAAGGRRKPNAGMLQEALCDANSRAEEAVYIGDSLDDMRAAAAAGCRRILVRTGKGRNTEAQEFPPEVLPLAVHDDLASAVAYLLGEQQC
jgi:D-glycero-D-manno-heptose 1,7-bisphosphate phosphatase